jgi:hypothetical protein
MCILERESILEKMVKGHFPCSPAGYCSKSWKSSSGVFWKSSGVFLQKYDILGFSRISRIILLKKNPWNRFTATWIGLTTRIKPSKSLFLDLISTADLGADGYDGLVLDSSAPAKSGVGRRYGRRRWGAPSSSYAASFSKPKAPT